MLSLINIYNLFPKLTCLYIQPGETSLDIRGMEEVRQQLQNMMKMSHSHMSPQGELTIILYLSEFLDSLSRIFQTRNNS